MDINLNDIQFSGFPSASNPKEQKIITLTEFDESIITGSFNGRPFKEDILLVRQLSQSYSLAQDETERKALEQKISQGKRSLPAVVSSGKVKATWKNEDFEVHNGLIQVDIDGKDNPVVLGDDAKLVMLTDRLKKDSYSFRVFKSPSGKGIKVLVKIPASKDTHVAYFKALEQYYLSTYNVIIDPACKNIARLMYLSYDPNLYSNNDSRIFTELPKDTASPVIQPEQNSQSHVDPITLDKIEKCINQIEQKKVDITGGYSQWLKLCFALATLGLNGRAYFHRISKFYNGYDMQACDDLFSQCLKSHNGKIGIGTFFHYCKIAGITTTDNPIASDEPEYKTPMISDFVKKNLPDFFQMVLAEIHRKREQDIAIITLFVLLANVFQNVYVIHDKQKCGLLFYLFVSAPPGSGKGIQNRLRKIFKSLDDLYEQDFKQDKEAFDEQMKLYNDGQIDTKPKEPVRKRFFISADSSKAAFLQTIKENEGRGVLFDTEGDTLSASFEQEWGNFSPELRKNFHHEDFSPSRKDNVSDIPYSAFSVSLSGTPDQLFRFFEGGVKSGLLSRFAQYSYVDKHFWDTDVFDSTGWEDAEKNYENLSLMVLHMFTVLKERTTQIIFTWERKHIATLNEKFSSWLDQVTKMHGKESPSVIFRLGVMTSRLAAILTITRMFSDAKDRLRGSERLNISVGNLDFKIVLEIMSLFMEHNFSIFEEMTAGQEDEKKSLIKIKWLKFLDALPDKFQRKTVIDEIAPKLNIGTRTADGYLQELVKFELLGKDNEGGYWKTEPTLATKGQEHIKHK